jgi:predicted DNA-binding transcriptional regulator AlpA
MKDKIMKTYSFHLIVNNSDISEETADKIYEISHDCIIGGHFGANIITFDREGGSFAEAVESAVKQIESIEGLYVVRVEPDICRRLQITHIDFYKLSSNKKPFPKPVYNLMGDHILWNWNEIVQWAFECKMVNEETVKQANYIENFNNEQLRSEIE